MHTFYPPWTYICLQAHTCTPYEYTHAYLYIATCTYMHIHTCVPAHVCIHMYAQSLECDVYFPTTIKKSVLCVEGFFYASGKSSVE